MPLPDVPTFEYRGDPVPLSTWCRTLLDGPNRCHYQWHGTDWHVTVITTNGNEVVHHGDQVALVGSTELAVFRKNTQ